MTYPGTYFDKDKTKFPHEFCQILDEVAYGRPAFGCLGNSRPYVVVSEKPLRLTAEPFLISLYMDCQAGDFVVAYIIHWGTPLNYEG